MAKKITKNFYNTFAFAFISIFVYFVFEVAISEKSKAQSRNLHVKSHLQFNRNFSGNSFVIDGDSIKVDKKEVRLFGIDAPEYKQTCFNAKKQEYPCGIVSHDFLANLVRNKKVECTYAEKDKYHRYLGKCYIDNISINEELVKNGMAIVYNFTESDQKLDKLEEEAKTKKIGVWQGSFQLPKDYRKQHPRK